MIRSSLRGLCIPLCVLSGAAVAQPTSDSPLAAPPNGMVKAPPSHFILTGATAHIAPGEVIQNAFIEINRGVIVSTGVSKDRAIPPGAIAIDCTGRHIYPGFIDAFVEVDAPTPDPDNPEAHWNTNVTPERRALDGDGLDKGTRESLRSLGFTAANLSPKGGVFRGSTSLISLREPSNDPADARPRIYLEDGPQVASFQTGGWAGTYPGSHMGAVALVRQTLSDAAWYATQDEPAPAPFAALGAGKDGPAILFDVNHEIKALHASAIGREFDRNVIIVGQGVEFRRLDAIARDGNPLIIPLRFPRTPDVSSLGAAESVELESLMTWEQAPTNPRRLLHAGLKVALTSSKLKNRADFLKNLRTAAKHGLTEDECLAMLTTTPADLLGVSGTLGSLHAGKAASLVMTDRPLLDEDCAILDVWTDGVRYRVNEPTRDDVSGTWTFTRTDSQSSPATVTIDVKEGKVTFTTDNDEPKFEGKDLKIDGPRLSFTLRQVTEEPKPDNAAAAPAPTQNHDIPVLVISAILEGDTLTGWARVDEARRLAFRGTRTGPLPPKDDHKQKDDDVTDVPETYGYPFGPYALTDLPPQQSIAFTNCTLWTSARAGIIEDGALLISGGKITYVGPSAGMPRITSDYRIVDARGLHITPGIIDTHSHTGTWALGTNEGTQACTSEVRISDSMDPGDIGFYRQLAGGVTTVQSLHGSANPIGGQALTQKLRWGAVHPFDTHFEGAIPGIKFALGENVKQSHWGDNYTTRYPQTRMGVDTFMRDRFLAARAYDERRRNGENVRPDLELDALAEILRGERWIHCHSYRQDEILMLCRIAGEFGFKIGAFQHVLEGYKVAEAIRENAVGASGFTDWWAYKFEVYDAIPWAFTIMHNVGVNVSFNSDSDDLARRLNTEAAKAVRYGGIDPAEAFKFVTINPAIQLGIADRVGSLEVGKDADIAIWSGDPLSTMTRCVSTWVDGREYFSLEQDAAHRAHIAAERQRLIQKVLTLGDRKNNDKDDSDKQDEGGDETPPQAFALRILREQVREQFIEAFNRGHDPVGDSCGVCGCSSLYQAFQFSQE